MPEGRKRAHDGDALGGGNDLIDFFSALTDFSERASDGY